MCFLPSYYCNGTGLTAPSGPCSPGYYCSASATTQVPNDGGVTGDPCTIGHYCPEGTAVPVPCAHGTYMNETGYESCWNCTPGSVDIDKNENINAWLEKQSYIGILT